MSVALIEPFEMTATLNVVVSANSTTVMQTYQEAPSVMAKTAEFHSTGTHNSDLAVIFFLLKKTSTFIIKAGVN